MIGSFSSIHFIGICGTAMAAVAAALKECGIRVTGSDLNVYPPMSTFLADRKIDVFQGYSEEHLDSNPSLVVIGNAMSRGNPEVEVTLDRKLRYCSLPELLKESFIRGKRSIVVAGTHGKTTTSALLTWIFESAGRNPGYLVGGMAKNLGQGARFTDSEWFIIEGDEYDTAFFDKRSKFVHYLPEIAIINNLEFDHADIFPDLGSIQTSFRRLINIIPRNGLLLANGDDKNLDPLLNIGHCPVKRFGLGPGNNHQAEQLCFDIEGSSFQVDGVDFRLPMHGELNVRNALAAVICARHCGISDQQIQQGLTSFAGIRRRMEIRGEAGGVTIIDDFGHHPTAMKETLRALQKRFDGRKLWALFEPRSNTTRRKVFQNELAEALGLADEIVVSQVARLEQIDESERLNPAQLMEDLKTAGRSAAYLTDVEAIVRHVSQGARTGDIVCVFSNGGFGGIHDKLLAALKSR